jgi:hypothetical protein
MLSSCWKDVWQELDRWGDLGLRARFWIRDDDACEITEQLARLHSLASRFSTRIGLDSDLSYFLKEHLDSFYPMCHGWKHVNYGYRGIPGEFGRERPTALLIADAESAFRVFCEHFNKQGNIRSTVQQHIACAGQGAPGHRI